jgi:hypothetical protein
MGRGPRGLGLQPPLHQAFHGHRHRRRAYVQALLNAPGRVLQFRGKAQGLGLTNAFGQRLIAPFSVFILVLRVPFARLTALFENARHDVAPYRLRTRTEAPVFGGFHSPLA